MMARSIHAASREEYLGHALNAEIRRLVADRRRWRAQPWHTTAEAAREADLYLRYLFSVRREGQRAFKADRVRLERAYTEIKDAMDRAQLADPEAPDYLSLMAESESRAMWGDR